MRWRSFRDGRIVGRKADFGVVWSDSRRMWSGGGLIAWTRVTILMRVNFLITTYTPPLSLVGACRREVVGPKAHRSSFDDD